MPVKRTTKTKNTTPIVKKKNVFRLKFLAPVLAMVITLAGVGVATQLAQRTQDVRSDASGCQYGATSCSNNTGLLWECDGNSFQEKPGPVICNQAAYDARYGNSNTNPDGSCKQNMLRCADGALQFCRHDKWENVTDSRGVPQNCGGVNPPAAGQVCNDNDRQCRNGEYWYCDCSYGNCSWQRLSAVDSCAGDFYTWGENPSQLASPGQAAQPGTGGESQTQALPVTIGGRVACLNSNANLPNEIIEISRFANGQVVLTDIRTDSNGRFSFATNTGENDFAIRMRGDKNRYESFYLNEGLTHPFGGTLCASVNKDGRKIHDAYYSYEFCRLPAGSHTEFHFTARDC